MPLLRVPYTDPLPPPRIIPPSPGPLDGATAPPAELLSPPPANTPPPTRPRGGPLRRAARFPRPPRLACPETPLRTALTQNPPAQRRRALSSLGPGRLPRHQWDLHAESPVPPHLLQRILR